MSISTASSARTRLRTEACDKGRVPEDTAQQLLSRVVTLNMLSDVCVSTLTAPQCLGALSTLSAEPCIELFATSKNSYKMCHLGNGEFWEHLVPCPFLFSLSVQQTHLGSLKCVHLVVISIDVACHSSVRRQSGRQTQKGKWYFARNPKKFLSRYSNKETVKKSGPWSHVLFGAHAATFDTMFWMAFVHH